MKQAWRTAVLVLIALCWFSLPAKAAAEKINSYQSDITINEDATISVAERIEYDFGDSNRHGIYWYLPYRYKARGGNYRLRIDQVTVTDENGQAYPFEKTFKGKDISLQIGDPDQTVTGVKKYEISYRVNRAINYFSDHDELYWNAIGTGWDVPIESAEIKLHLPQKLSSSDLTEACYIGGFASTDNCQGGLTEDGLTSAYTASSLNPRQGMTVALGLPKGIVAEPSRWQKTQMVVMDNWILCLPIVTLILMFYLWSRFGRDSKGRGTIIPEYDPPENLLPMMVGTVVDERADDKDMSAEIINLAVNGYLKINRIESKKTFGTKIDYELQRLKDREQPANPIDQKLLSSLFKDDKSQVKLSELKTKFYQDMTNLRNMAYRDLVKRKYYPKNPNTVRWSYVAGGLLVGVIGFPLVNMIGMLAVGSTVSSGIIIAGFGYFMPARTVLGVEIRERILGLKTYLSVAEKERIAFHNAPEKSPERFEKLLPYAMVLGVERAWANQFKDIYKSPPRWYGGHNNSDFTTLLFVSNLGDFSNSAKATLGAVPSSAAGGSSGFSGGGVGGGFGGGGGGSW